MLSCNSHYFLPTPNKLPAVPTGRWQPASPPSSKVSSFPRSQRQVSDVCCETSSREQIENPAVCWILINVVRLPSGGGEGDVSLYPSDTLQISSLHPESPQQRHTSGSSWGWQQNLCCFAVNRERKNTWWIFQKSELNSLKTLFFIPLFLILTFTKVRCPYFHEIMIVINSMYVCV